jgi:hypothetical protein
MADYLADVQMPPQAPEPEPEPEGPLPLTDDVIEKQLDLEFAEEEGYDIEDKDGIPEPVMRKKIPQEEIFSPPKVKPIAEPKEERDAPQPKQKKTRAKRGPASAEQLEILARGRKRAAENRARKKKEQAEKALKDKEDVELAEKLKDRERAKIKKRLEIPIEEELSGKPTIIEKEKVVEKGYSQEQLDEAVQRAVEQSVHRVETLRKQRKDQKQKAEAKAKHEAQVFKEINRAIKPSGWDICFM